MVSHDDLFSFSYGVISFSFSFVLLAVVYFLLGQLNKDYILERTAISLSFGTWCSRSDPAEQRI
jgi:hypothetical protein